MVYHSGNQLIDPHVLFEKIGLAPRMHIADFGSGRTGNFVFPAAKIVGEKGGIYAVDIVKESLQGLAKPAELNPTHNIHTGPKRRTTLYLESIFLDRTTFFEVERRIILDPNSILFI